MKLSLSKFLVISLATAVFSTSSIASTHQLTKLSSTGVLSIDELQYAFGGNQEVDIKLMTNQEMIETEGAIAPLVAVGVMTGARFIAQRWVTQKVAQNMVRKGATNILAPNRAVAKRIAGNNPIREYHPGPGSRYTHYHPNPRNGSHVWYGNPR